MNKQNKNRKTTNNRRNTERRTKGYPQQLSTFVRKSDLNGGKFAPSVNPPDITYQPWSTLVLAFNTPPKSFTFADLIPVFRTQIDPLSRGLNQIEWNKDKGLTIQFKFQSVAVWNLTGRAVSLTVWDDSHISASSADNQDQLGSWVDCGSQSAFPCVGYLYPHMHRSQVHHINNTTKAANIFTITASANQDSILCHFKISWKFWGPVKFPTVNIKSPSVTAIVSQIKNVITEIKNQQPSTVSKIIDGVEKAASVVAIASGLENLEYVSESIASSTSIDKLEDLLEQLEVNENV